MLRIRVLGELEVQGSDGPIELGGSWRARSLLAWLALHPGEHLRSELAPRFWPEVLDSSARASLRNSLWAIRRALGPDAAALLTTRERVGLGGDVSVDLAEFREHLAAGHLDEALELAGGELLAGLDDEWVLEERDEHRAALSDLLERLAARAESAGDLAEAIALSRRRATLDPLDEDAARALIGRLARSGDRAGALAAFERIRDRFRRELGISASEETRALAAEIREGAGISADAASEPRPAPIEASPGGSWEPGVPFPLPPRLRRSARVAFVGRDRELDALRAHWASVESGEGARLVLVAGEPGVGKTRLAREIALEADAAGAVVLHGSADEDLLVLHQPLVTALGHYLSVASPAELDRRVRPRAADLEAVAPELAGAERSEGSSTESRRYRLFEAVAALLEELSAEAPVLLVIDDLHWADQSTIAILRHAFESRPEMRLLAVATQRTVDAQSSGETAEALARLARSEFAHRLPLDGLAETDVARLAEGLGSGLPEDVVRGIRQQTRGNPFFVQEIVSDLHERGDTRLLSLDTAAVPARIGEVLGLRLDRLSEPCGRLLTVAAVIGSDFRLAPLERVSDLTGDDLAAALDEAMSAHVVVETEAGDHETFSFSHALLRRTLLSRLTRAHQRRIHARVAEALEATEGEAALLEIAHHLCEARPVSDRDHALEYATRAAEQATNGLAYAEAVDLFTRARSLLPEGDERRRKLALKRAVAYQALFHVSMDAPAPG
jgi:DNA-binding SARP family transcriptional activator/KaiC/GvpD/RAD55 family RecA-like ATPase